MNEDEGENASNLEFGTEFAAGGVQYLSNDEVYFILKKKVDQNKSGQASTEYEYCYFNYSILSFYVIQGFWANFELLSKVGNHCRSR